MKKKLQVFVSSTYLDLKEERQAAVSAILKTGHIPAGMELFTSGDQSQMSIIRKWIDESDIYMLILGGRYGSIEESSGVSYTELEYDYAKEQGKPIFAVVISEGYLDNKVKKHGKNILESENQSELVLFKKKVLSNISSFFDDIKDIKLCIHESLYDFSENRELVGWVSAKEITNNQQLLDEIAILRKENKEFSELLTLEKEKNNGASSTINDNELDELIDTLDAIKIKVPKDIIKTKDDVEHSLLGLFNIFNDSIAVGTTNKVGIDELNKFLYYNICPKLQVYELVINQGLQGVHYRIFNITEKGNELLRYINKKEMLTKKKDNL